MSLFWAIWIIAVGILISIGIKEAIQIAYDGKEVKKEIINIASTDTLLIKFKNNDFYSKDIYHNIDFTVKQDEKNNEIIYSNNVSIEILITDDLQPYLLVEKLAVGKSAVDSKNRAKKIKYNYTILGNQLILNNYLLTDVANKFRNQRVELYLYLPKGIFFKADDSVQNYDRTSDDLFNLRYSSAAYVYQVSDSQIKCLNCPIIENEYNETVNIQTNTIKKDSVTNTTVKVNGQKVIVNEISKPKKTVPKSKLSVDQNGVIIKTN